LSALVHLLDPARPHRQKLAQLQASYEETQPTMPTTDALAWLLEDLRIHCQMDKEMAEARELIKKYTY
jgi:hypothetical protein